MIDPRPGATDEPRFDDRDVSRILKRAAQLQRAEPSAPDPTGLSLSELTEIAREAGIDPAAVRQAALEVRHGGGEPSVGERLAGAPMRLAIEEVVAAVTPSETFDALVPIIQAATAGHGTASVVGRTLTWSSTTEGNTSGQQVLVSVRDGKTLIRAEEQHTGMAAGVFGGVVGGVGGGLGFGGAAAVGALLGSPAVAVAFPVLVTAGAYVGARAWFRHYVAGRRRAMRALVDEIVGVVGAAERYPAETD